MARAKGMRFLVYFFISFHLFLGSKGGAVARALASLAPVWLRLKSGVDVKSGLSLLSIFSIALRVFLRVLWFKYFPLLKNQHFQIPI